MWSSTSGRIGADHKTGITVQNTNLWMPAEEEAVSVEAYGEEILK